MSLLIDKFGWFGIEVHPLSGMRMLGAVLMVAGIGLIVVGHEEVQAFERTDTI